MYTPYDFNQNIAHRAEYAEQRLRGGSPVVGLSYANGLLLFTVRHTQRKIFEIYDRLLFGALGNQADVEAIRLAALDFAHQEGFSRSPDDVSIQRLVGFAISPPLKRIFGDPMSTPHVVRALFGEIGSDPGDDLYFVLNYDGEFTSSHRTAAVAGSAVAEEAMNEILAGAEGAASLDDTLQTAARVWQQGLRAEAGGGEEEDVPADSELMRHFTEPEAGILERATPRESKFRLLPPPELDAARAVLSGSAG